MDLAVLGVVVERLPIGVLMFEQKRMELVFVNAAARRLLKAASARIRGPIPDPWPHYSLRQYAERLVDQGVAVDERVEVDAERVYEVSGITLRESTAGVILIEDVSGRERRSRVEREFVANAAHELLTPLTGIVGAAHVLQAGAKTVPEDRDKFIDHIAHECSRLTRIARSLLILARAQSGEEPPRLEILPVRELLEETLEQVNAPVAVHCDSGITVFADADLFVQAATNLMVNALRHGSGNAITVEVAQVGKNLVEIDVLDAAATHSDAASFQARFRSAAGRDGGGFGLGLSIAEQSLEVMGGRLLLQPEGARMQLPRGGLSD